MESVWIQHGSLGFRWNTAGLERNLAEWEARYLKRGDTYAVHAGDCHLGKTSPNGCTCTPEIRTVGVHA